MVLPPGYKITTQLLLNSTVVFALVNLIFVHLLAWRVKVGFAFFEYTLYWCIILSAAMVMVQVFRKAGIWLKAVGAARSSP
jgi:hypothetical protein